MELSRVVQASFTARERAEEDSDGVVWEGVFAEAFFDDLRRLVGGGLGLEGGAGDVVLGGVGSVGGSPDGVAGVLETLLPPPRARKAIRPAFTLSISSVILSLGVEGFARSEISG